MNDFMDPNQDQEKERKKKVLLMGIAVCVVLIIALAVMILYIQQKDAHTFKAFIDDQEVGVAEGFYINDEDGNTYVRAKELANLIGWSYQNGEYGSFEENINSGYLQNEYEVASFVSGSNELKKYIQVTLEEEETKPEEGTTVFTAKSQNGTVETIQLDLPILSMNDQIYFPLSCLNVICNTTYNYSDPNRMYIYSPNYLINMASVKANEYGYSLSGYYENIRTLSYDMMIVNKNNLWGVISMSSGQQVLGFKYSDIVFNQKGQEFFVKATGNDGEETVGIISKDGNTVISPKSYEDISVLSDEFGLYLVEKNNKFGVLDRSGNVVVHAEYDKIGIPEEILTSYGSELEDNYILFKNTIVVEADGKYGLYNLEGKKTLDTLYYGIGYDVSLDDNADKNAESALCVNLENIEMIDDTTRNVQGIIIQYKDLDGNIKYGMYDAVMEKLIVGCNFDSIYSVTTGGVTTYYIKFLGEASPLRESIANSPDVFK